jgi:hypothetical protein
MKLLIATQLAVTVWEHIALIAARFSSSSLAKMGKLMGVSSSTVNESSEATGASLIGIIMRISPTLMGTKVVA